MSITRDFEALAGTKHAGGETVFNSSEVILLLAHTRQLEAMLKKHEWCTDCGCPECEGGEVHKPDCELAKLLEGVEASD